MSGGVVDRRGVLEQLLVGVGDRKPQLVVEVLAVVDEEREARLRHGVDVAVDRDAVERGGDEPVPADRVDQVVDRLGEPVDAVGVHELAVGVQHVRHDPGRVARGQLRRVLTVRDRELLEVDAGIGRDELLAPPLLRCQGVIARVGRPALERAGQRLTLEERVSPASRRQGTHRRRDPPQCPRLQERPPGEPSIEHGILLDAPRATRKRFHGGGPKSLRPLRKAGQGTVDGRAAERATEGSPNGRIGESAPGRPPYSADGGAVRARAATGPPRRNPRRREPGWRGPCDGLARAVRAPERQRRDAPARPGSGRGARLPAGHAGPEPEAGRHAVGRVHRRRPLEPSHRGHRGRRRAAAARRGVLAARHELRDGSGGRRAERPRPARPPGRRADDVPGRGGRRGPRA